MLEDYFYSLADALLSRVADGELITLNLEAERSDFVRFNRGKVRQPGRVEQVYATLQLARGRRHLSSSCSMSGTIEQDSGALSACLNELRNAVSDAPEDPHLLLNTEPASTRHDPGSQLPSGEQMTEDILRETGELDMAGLLAAGSVYVGFANSLGQRNWFASHTFNFDFSAYLDSKRASKGRYAGFRWDREELRAALQRSREQLAVLNRPEKKLAPGYYNAYLSPSALSEVFALLSWEGFGLKAQRTHHSPFEQLQDGERCLSSKFSLSEQTSLGAAPGFQQAGFVKPDRVPLVEHGNVVGSLVSPRSAIEYGVETNGADTAEGPRALSLEGGGLPTERALAELGEGLFVSELWYMNYSDRPRGRMTGMTRFATFWVENGQLSQPVDVMRFDESLYRIFGDNLLELTQERELLLFSGTYDRRDLGCYQLPGALVRDFNLTL